MRDHLPGVLARLAEAVNEGAALRFAAEFGGQEIYLPAPERIDAAHHLAKALGLDLARTVAAVLGPPGRLLVPLGPTSSQRRSRASIQRLTAEGQPVGSIARTVGVHERSVYRQRQRERAAEENRPPDLFTQPIPRR